MARQKGDICIKTYDGRRVLFSEWLAKLETLIKANGPLAGDVTHFELVDGFKHKRYTPEHAYGLFKAK